MLPQERLGYQHSEDSVLCLGGWGWTKGCWAQTLPAAPTDWGSILCSTGLQPTLVARVWEFLLHHRDVFTGQLQLQVLQDRGPRSPK